MSDFFDVSQTVYGVPRSHWGCTFENYRWQSEGHKKAISEFMERLLVANERKNLLLTGTAGVGKTHLAVALYRWGVLHWGTADCCFVEVSSFLADVKRGFDDRDRPDPFEGIEAATKLVVLDDLVGRNWTPWERDQGIVRLISSIHSNGAAIVATTNFTLDQLSGILQPHELSRLMDSAMYLVFSGADQRPVR